MKWSAGDECEQGIIAMGPDVDGFYVVDIGIKSACFRLKKEDEIRPKKTKEEIEKDNLIAEARNIYFDSSSPEGFIEKLHELGMLTKPRK